MEGIESVIDQKLGELKKSLLSEIQSSIDTYIEAKKVELQEFFDANKMKSNTLDNEIAESIKVIQDHVAVLRAENNLLSKQVDDLQQYTRRPVRENETIKDVKDLVSQIIADSGVELPPNSIDRAHRTGKVTTNSNTKEKTKPIIIRFTSFRDRTAVYKARAKIKEMAKCSLSLDLTANRYKLLKDARTLVENVSDINVVYTDINCNLRAFTSKEEHVLFESMSDLNDIVSSFG